MALTRADYDAYVRAFNDRDYDALHAFFADNVVLEAHGFALCGKTRVRQFYDTFHAYVRETVTLNAFYECGDTALADLSINFVGKRTLTSSVMEGLGLPAGPDVPQGADFDIHYLILYHTRLDGRIVRIQTATYEPPASE